VSTTTIVRRPPRDWVNGLLSVWGVLVFVFLFLPIVMIVIYSFNDGRALVVWRQFGFGPYSAALSNRVITGAVFTSIRAAAGAAVIATIVGSLAGIALARRPGKWTIAFLAFVFLVLVTPEIVDAISLLIWYVRIGGPFGPDNQVFNYGLLRLFIGHALFASAVVTLIVRARLAGLDESLEEASADLYANATQTFRKITLPLMMPAVLAGALLAFSLSLDNTIISSFVSTANASPWPVYVFSSLRSILRPEIAAMSTLVLLLTLFALAMVALVLRRGGASGEEAAAMIAGVEAGPSSSA
jgi:putrescine transport system permease protein